MEVRREEPNRDYGDRGHRPLSIYGHRLSNSLGPRIAGKKSSGELTGLISQCRVGSTPTPATNLAPSQQELRAYSWEGRKTLGLEAEWQAPALQAARSGFDSRLVHASESKVL